MTALPGHPPRFDSSRYPACHCRARGAGLFSPNLNRQQVWWRGIDNNRLRC